MHAVPVPFVIFYIRSTSADYCNIHVDHQYSYYCNIYEEIYENTDFRFVNRAGDW